MTYVAGCIAVFVWRDTAVFLRHGRYSPLSDTRPQCLRPTTRPRPPVSLPWKTFSLRHVLCCIWKGLAADSDSSSDLSLQLQDQKGHHSPCLPSQDVPTQARLQALRHSVICDPFAAGDFSRCPIADAFSARARSASHHLLAACNIPPASTTSSLQVFGVGAITEASCAAFVDKVAKI